MRLSKPRSLSGLMLLGFSLVAVALLIAMVNAAVQIRRLASQSDELVVQGVQVTRYNQLLFEQIASLERSARLYRIIGNRELLEVYRQTNERLRETLDTLSRLTHHVRSEAQLEILRGESLLMLQTLQQWAMEQTLREIAAPKAGQNAPKKPDSGLQQTDFQTTATPAQQAPTTDFSNMWEAVTALSEVSRRQIDSQLDTLHKATDSAQRSLIWLSVGLLPFMLAMVLVFTLWLARPIRQLDRVIGELGRGTFSRPIKVNGPRDLEQLGHQLEWLRVRLLDLAQEKNRFLRHMSHELKTPLANIREGTELLMDGSVGALGDDQREVAAILRDNGLKLQRLIENLLSFSAWQAQSIGLELSEFQLRPLIKSVLEAQQLTLVSQRVQLDIEIEDIAVTADRQKLKLILDNLLSNAVKFTPRGGKITIHAGIKRNQLIIDVADSGPGIPPQDRGRIFEAFYQGKAQQGGHVKGTGIGLSVVIEFVHAHSGTIEIVDGEYPGAHFRVKLPLQQKAGTSREPAHAA